MFLLTYLLLCYRLQV